MHKEIEVVPGDGSNLNISPVENHIKKLRPKQNEKKNFVIPSPIEKKNKKNKPKKSEN